MRKYAVQMLGERQGKKDKSGAWTSARSGPRKRERGNEKSIRLVQQRLVSPPGKGHRLRGTGQRLTERTTKKRNVGRDLNPMGEEKKRSPLLGEEKAREGFAKMNVKATLRGTERQPVVQRQWADAVKRRGTVVQNKFRKVKNGKGGREANYIKQKENVFREMTR